MARRSVSKSNFMRLARPNSGVLCSIAVSVVVVALAQIVGAINLASVRSISITVLGIGFIIFVHELGHFLVAKACGVKCEKFYLGFDVNGLKLLSFKWGETEYGIGAIPLGGYVKMLGQDDNVANAEEETERTKIRNADGSVTVDPRSYTAKSIPQRMAIISAGVIMNLIFAVIFATVAFTYGVEYEPCVIGAVSGGGAAWKAGIEPGDRIVQFGKRGSPSQHLRYDTDLMEKVFLHDVTKDLDLLVQKPSGEQVWVATRPKAVFAGKSLFRDEYVPRLGVIAARSLELTEPAKLKETELTEWTKWHKEIRGGDRIVAVNGKKLQNQIELAIIEADLADQPIKLTIERTLDHDQRKLTTPETYEVIAPPAKRRELGVFFRLGAVSAVHSKSIGETAGIRPGDILRTVNGEPIKDATSLPLIFANLAGKEVKLGLFSGGEKKEEREITLTPGKLMDPVVPYPSSEIALDGIGICMPLECVIAEVGEGLKKQKVDIIAGDIVIAIQTEFADENGKPDLSKWVELRNEHGDGTSITEVANSSPSLKALHLRLKRGDKVHEMRLIPEYGETYAIERGIPLDKLHEIRQTSKPLEALKLGARETYESAGKVLTFLKKLATGGVSPTKLGGPLSIAYVANQQASLGISRFLLFLTLISANLAIVNFLPIPVLDGGHMMFLTAEAIRGKPVDEKWLIRLSVMGLIFVMSLMLFVISLDVLRFSGVNV